MGQSLTVLFNLDHREVIQAPAILEGPYKVVTWIDDVVYWMQQHPRAKIMVVHLNRLEPYLWAAWDEYP
jgi:hypothetical protein